MRAFVASILFGVISLSIQTAAAQSAGGGADAMNELLNSLNPQQAAVMADFSGAAFEARKKCDPDSSGGGCDVKREGQYCPSFEQKTGKCVMRSDESCFCDPKALNNSAVPESLASFE